MLDFKILIFNRQPINFLYYITHFDLTFFNTIGLHLLSYLQTFVLIHNHYNTN